MNLDKIQKLVQDVLLENLYIAFYWIDRDGFLIGCNERELQILRAKSIDDVVSKHVTKLGPVEVWKNLESIMGSGRAQVIEEKYKIDGQEKAFLSIKNPLIENNKVVGLLGISIDITDRKRAEKLMIEKEAAENSAKTMEMISGFIAHEMKTPLAVINLNNDLLGIDLNKKDLILDSKEERDKISNYHDNIKFSVRSANNVIDMLLTKLSNLNLSAQKLGPSDYEFQSAKGIINAVIKEYPFLKRERNLIHWDPSTNSDFKYFGDKDLTKNVLFNLVKNALRAIKEYDKGEIFITLKPGDKFNYLIFKDTGIGIAKEHMSTLFQQFNSHIENGTGLGLSFCKMVMKSYGGDITCKSAQGQYTEFTLSFPKDGGKEPTLKQKIAMRKRKLL